jgi:transcriptional regulator with XRE-family HTH domain
MPATQTLQLAAHCGAPDLLEPPSTPPPHLVLVAAAGASPAELLATRRQEFGPRLKAARERSGVGLDDIAQATKVSLSLLAALERGDVSRWPKGIFRRAFFRDYVTSIGLPVEQHVREFLELFPDGEDHPVSASVTVPPPEAAIPLRLTLAPESRWSVSRRQVRDTLADFPAVLLLALVLTWWIDAGAWAGAGMIGLCYYRRVVAVIRSRAVSSWRRRWSGAGAPQR